MSKKIFETFLVFFFLRKNTWDAFSLLSSQKPSEGIRKISFVQPVLAIIERFHYRYRAFFVWTIVVAILHWFGSENARFRLPNRPTTKILTIVSCWSVSVVGPFNFHAGCLNGHNGNRIFDKKKYKRMQNPRRCVKREGKKNFVGKKTIPFLSKNLFISALLVYYYLLFGVNETATIIESSRRKIKISFRSSFPVQLTETETLASEE